MKRKRGVHFNSSFFTLLNQIIRNKYIPATTTVMTGKEVLGSINEESKVFSHFSRLHGSYARSFKFFSEIK